jgi:hypothetical protein
MTTWHDRRSALTFTEGTPSGSAGDTAPPRGDMMPATAAAFTAVTLEDILTVRTVGTGANGESVVACAEGVVRVLWPCALQPAAPRPRDKPGEWADATGGVKGPGPPDPTWRRKLLPQHVSPS